jgi:hypothetical protein
LSLSAAPDNLVAVLAVWRVGDKGNIPYTTSTGDVECPDALALTTAVIRGLSIDGVTPEVGDDVSSDNVGGDRDNCKGAGTGMGFDFKRELGTLASPRAATATADNPLIDDE